jgi:hypothetical protein
MGAGTGPMLVLNAMYPAVRIGVEKTTQTFDSLKRIVIALKQFADRNPSDNINANVAIQKGTAPFVLGEDLSGITNVSLFDGPRLRKEMISRDLQHVRMMESLFNTASINEITTTKMSGWQQFDFYAVHCPGLNKVRSQWFPVDLVNKLATISTGGNKYATTMWIRKCEFRQPQAHILLTTNEYMAATPVRRLISAGLNQNNIPFRNVLVNPESKQQVQLNSNLVITSDSIEFCVQGIHVRLQPGTMCKGGEKGGLNIHRQGNLHWVLHEATGVQSCISHAAAPISITVAAQSMDLRS